MPAKLVSLFLLAFLFMTQLSAQTPPVEAPATPKNTLNVLVKKSMLPASDATADQEAPFLLNGIRQAITGELLKKELDSEIFWQKIEAKNLSDSDEIALLKVLFTNAYIVILPEAIPDPKAAEASKTPPDQFRRATFIYEFNHDVTKNFFDEILIGLPDPSLKTFYIVPDINIAQDMLWSDVGVSKKENFSGVIIESWKSWASSQFKNFSNIVVLDKDLTKKPDTLNPESVTLKWNSFLKKGQTFQDRKSAPYELNAQYILVSTKTNQTLLAFDFPVQKREISVLNPKELSSNLASLIYNLLNSQTAKITSAVELNRATSTLSIVEIKIIGKHGLFDITQINTFLMGHFKNLGLTSTLKSYSSESSIISIKSSASAEVLYAHFAKEGGKFPLNEQKILLFSPESKAFAIIPKEANN